MLSIVELGAVIVAVVQAVKFARKGEWDSLITIVIATVLGLLAGLVGIADLTWLTGIYASLAAVGVVTTVSKIGGTQ